MMTGEQTAIQAGDYVQLVPRERPHGDKATFWWKVVDLHDNGLDCFYEAQTRVERGAREIVPPRFHVGFDKVLAHRHPNEAA